MSSSIKKIPHLSLAALIAANMIPLVGVLFFDWDHTLVIALFWIENLIIGAYNIARMITVMIVEKSLRSLFHPVFFLFHYGLFCMVHGQFLWDVLDMGTLAKPSVLFGIAVGGPLELVARGAAVFNGFVAVHNPVIWLGIIGLLLSRGVSFIENFILKGEVFETSVQKLMGRPYKQIVIMQVGIILGAAAIEKFGSSILLLLVIVVFKVVVDSIVHVRDHNKNRSEITSMSPTE